jgi:tetratricopeptide (TPR) repeat protein
MITKPKREVINSYEKLKKETDRLRTENELWQTDFNKLLDLRNKATKLEKSDKLSMAIDSYLSAMDFGEKSTKLSINNYSHDIQRIIILYGKIKETENLISFLQKVISTYPEYRDVKKWAIRLSKLTVNDTKKTMELKPSDITIQIAGNPTIGKQFENFKNTLPEFNFYHDLPTGMQTFEYLRLNKTIPTNKANDLRNFRESFKIILSKAKIAENQKDYKTAIEAYEKLIVEEYEGKEPYERLMVIFRKLKWLEKEEDILKRAISFFEKLKEKQKNTGWNLRL